MLFLYTSKENIYHHLNPFAALEDFPEKEMKKITKTSLNSIVSTGSIDKFFAYEKLDDILLATDDGW
jgi:UDP-galactopyranose mutase